MCIISNSQHSCLSQQVQDSGLNFVSRAFRCRLKSVYHRLSLTDLRDMPSVPELAKVHKHAAT